MSLKHYDHRKPHLTSAFELLEADFEMQEEDEYQRYYRFWHDAFIAPIMIRQKIDTIYEIVYKAYTYGYGIDKNLVLNYKPSLYVQNLIGEADDIVYYAYSHPDKNVMENIRMLGRVFGQKIIPVLKEKEYIKEVTDLDTILPFVNKYIQNMKKALKEAQIKSIS